MSNDDPVRVDRFEVLADAVQVLFSETTPVTLNGIRTHYSIPVTSFRVLLDTLTELERDRPREANSFPGSTTWGKNVQVYYRYVT